MDFIAAVAIRNNRQGKPDIERVHHFISTFNDIIRKEDKSTGPFHANTNIDHIPRLNDVDFELAVEKAENAGWKLTGYEENYQSYQYKMEMI
jgi:hypothetical protein